MKNCISYLLIPCITASYNSAYINHTIGYDVVISTWNQLESVTETTDWQFLPHLAYVLTNYGQEPIDNHGIFQVNETIYNQFVDSCNSTYGTSHLPINIPSRPENSTFCNDITFYHSTVPIYAGFMIQTIAKPKVLISIEDQANAYEEIYGYDRADFYDTIAMASIHNHTNCLADVVFLIDSSNSISQTDFNTTKYFVNSVVADLPVSTNQTNVGVIQYSGNLYYGLPATTLANYYHFYPFPYNLNYTILPYMNFRHYANGFERFFFVNM